MSRQVRTRKELLAEIKSLKQEIDYHVASVDSLCRKNNDLRMFLQGKIEWLQKLVEEGKTPKLTWMIEDFTRAHERNK